MAKKKKYKPMSYVKIAKPGEYKSAYGSQLTATRNQLMNWKYDPMKDANYQALAAVYGARGNQAAQDTLGDAAALNGGYGTSYAVSAAQQARNQYNQELAALIPDLEANAYSRMQNNYSMLMDADNTAYSRYRDMMADYQWGKGYDTDVYQYKQSQKKSGGGGGGGRSGGGGYSGGGGGGYTTDTGNDPYGGALKEIKKERQKNKKPQYKITKNTGQKKQMTTYGGRHGGRIVE